VNIRNIKPGEHGTLYLASTNESKCREPSEHRGSDLIRMRTSALPFHKIQDV
jgi:hypothetical protein